MTMAQPSAERRRVSVVIPHAGDDNCLKLCIDSIRRQTFPGELTSVVIILNERDRRDLDFALLENEEMLWEPAGSSYRSRNCGIKASRDEVIAFTDSDTIPSSNWLSAGLSALSAKKADLVAGRIDTVTSVATRTWPALYESLFSFDQEKNVRGGFSATANLFVTRNAMETYGQFDETAFSGEDFSWTNSSVKAGARLVYAPHAVVKHPCRETWSSLLMKARRTTAPYSRAGQRDGPRRPDFWRRAWFQLTAAPSLSKKLSLSRSQRLVARLVRLYLTIYKGVCLLNLSPQFRRDVETFAKSVRDVSVTGEELVPACCT